MESEARIRVATPDDATAIRDIYAPFCESTAVTFEESPPTAAEMADRVSSTLERHPWLVCDVDGDVVGYAYAGPLRKRRAYEWVVELSIYVAESARGVGVGSALYDALFAILERQGIRDGYAVTTVPNPETERFHERLGFERVVDFPAIGYTQGEWHDVAWWRKRIGEKRADPDRPTPFADLRDRSSLEPLLETGESLLDASGLSDTSTDAA